MRAVYSIFFAAGLGITFLTASLSFAKQNGYSSPGASLAQMDLQFPSPSELASDKLLSPPSGISPKATFEFIPMEARLAATVGNAAFAKGNFPQAVRAYQKVLELAPNNLVGLVNLGITQCRMGDISSAEKNLKHAVSLRIETGVAWLTLGTVYMDQNRLDEALAALTQARLYDSQNARVHNYLGVVMNRLNWSDAAESELRTAVELNPGYSDAHYNLAVIYMSRNPPSIELAKRHYYIAVKNGAIRDANMEKSFKVE